MAKKQVKKKQEKKEPALRKSTRAWYDAVVAKYYLDPHHEMLLELAGRAWDRAWQASQAIRRDGLVYQDRFKQPHAHPACMVEIQAMTQYARLLREINLSVSSPDEIKLEKLQ